MLKRQEVFSGLGLIYCDEQKITLAVRCIVVLGVMYDAPCIMYGVHVCALYYIALAALCVASLVGRWQTWMFARRLSGS